MSQKFHKGITFERFDKFTSKTSFNDVNLYSKLYKKRIKTGISLESNSIPDLKRVPFNEATKGQFRPAKCGDSFGPSWSTVWFKVKVELDLVSVKGELVEFHWDADCEGMVWSKDGHPIQGLTGGNGWDRRVEYALDSSICDHVFYIELACNGMFGVGDNGQINPPDPNKYFTLKQAELVIVDCEVRDLMYDFDIIASMARECPQDSQVAADAFTAANAIVNVCFPDDYSTWPQAKAIASDFFKRHGANDRHRINAIGHCHIDTAWLWPYDETKRKCARSWSSQIQLMKQYPEYKFACSQAQQFEWVEQLYPQLFDEIKEYTRKGQFIPIGGTWVEMDCNIPSGESFVRQFLYGQRYFEEKFGHRCKVFWLPDTFGYAAQLPQIIKLSDMEYFLTQKLSWNNINKFPHTTFMWQALDGKSQVLTHFPPADSYCSQATVKEVLYAEKNHKDKLSSSESMYVYGNGDGGGGPLPTMIERLKRMKDIQGLPKCDFVNPNEFFDKISFQHREMPIWKGELYFELHRGTYTSQAKNKKFNRKCEYLLRDLEYLSVLLCDNENKKQLDEMWKLVLLNQFHDVLPGSSIEMVFEDSTKMYTHVMTAGSNMKQGLFDSIMSKYLTPGKSSEQPKIFCINSLGIGRKEVVKIPLQQFSNRFVFDSFEVETTLGSFVNLASPTVQISNEFAYAVVECNGFAMNLSHPVETMTKSQVEFKSNNVFVLENEFVSATIDAQTGELIEYFDKKAQRQILSGPGNLFRIFDDIPIFWDAWDVEVYHLEKSKRPIGSATVQILDKGPLISSVSLSLPLTASSHLHQVISLSALSPRLDFETEIKWNENRKFLKVEFPFNINSDFATYETAYGWLQRPTHFNTSWDLAKFEVCGHKFADFSEYGYGVALLNDCKYGYATHGNVMRLSLLRSPKAPDAHCDIGHHSFKYALFPHQGSFTQSTLVVEEALKFNVDLISHVVPGNLSFGDPSFVNKPWFQLSPNNLVLDCVKFAEDDPKAVVLRFYESYGGRGSALINCRFPVEKVSVVNLLEDDLGSNLIRRTENNPYQFSIAFSPFQIISLKLVFK